jgi:hypothetical protein
LDQNSCDFGVAIDSKDKRIIAQSISKERNMFVAERLLSYYSRVWKASGFNRWMDLESTCLPVSKTKSSYSFSFGGKFDRKNYVINKG